jgi:localization factor PodJL
MPSDQSWSLEGLAPELRALAQEEARRRGMRIEEWLQSLIQDAAVPTLPDPSQGTPAMLSARAGGGPFEAIATRLDDLSQQLAGLNREPDAIRAPVFAAAPAAPPQAINETLTRLDQRLDTLVEQGRSSASELESRIAAVDRALAALDQGHAPAGQTAEPELASPYTAPVDTWALGLDHAVAEITARQQLLDEREAPPPLKQQFAALSRRLEDTDPRAAVSPPMTGAGALHADLRHLGDELRELRRPNSFDHAVEALRQDLAAIGRKLDDAAPRHAIQSIETEVRTLSERVDQGRERGETSPALARIEEVLGQLRNALSHFTPAETLATFREEVRALDRKIEAAASNSADASQNAATLRQLERSVAELGKVASHAASGEALVALAEEVQAIGDKIDRLTAATGRERQEYTSLIDRRFQELASLLDARAQAAFDRAPGNITALVEQIAGKIERVEVGHDQSTMLDAIATQITRLTEHVEASDARFDTLDHFERGLRTMLDSMEGLRAGAASVAEQAVRQAVAEIARQLPAGGPEVADLRQDVDALRQNHMQSDRRTQDTLEAVHDTLERLVDRLAMVETGLRSDRDLTTERGLYFDHLQHRQEPRALEDIETIAAPSLAPSPLLATPQAAQAAALLQGERVGPLSPVDMDALRAPAALERRAIDPNLPADHPLEPGTAAARGRQSASAAERIAASEAALGPAKPALESDSKANFIAAARRAAQAAANMAPPPDAKLESGKSSSSFSAIAKRLAGRRPLMLAFALLIGAGALHIAINGFGVFDEAPASKPTAVATLPAKTKPAAPARHSQTTASQPPPAASVPAPSSPTLPMAVPAPKAEPEPVAASAILPDSMRTEPRTMPAVSPLAISSIQLPGATDVTGSVDRLGSPATPSSGPSSAAPGTPLAAISADLPPSFGKSLRAAAHAGHPAAEYEVATRFAEGRGVTTNFEEAARWFERAASHGLAPAQYRLGSLYEKGQGVKKDIDQARRLYRSASDHGNAKAMHNLAVLYAEGIDGKPDLKLAAEWFRRAATRGIADSQYNLGILYARGLGVEQNLAESYKWFALAAQQGDQDAGKKRDDVATRMDQHALVAARLATQTFVVEQQPDEAVNVRPPAGGWDAAPRAAPTGAPAAPARQKKSAPRPKPALSAPQNIKPS